jgi:AcrR family transcriptional regulator
MSRAPSIPRGRDAVKHALVRAATELFAAHGPAAVSVRDVAAHAGVNHGLVHRHFGSKEQLVAEVMAALRSELHADLPADDDSIPIAVLVREALAAMRRHRAWWQILARALLDGEDPRKLHATFPVIDRLRRAIERAPASALRGVDPRFVTAIVVATGLGFVLFAPFLRAAASMRKDEWDRYEAALPAILAELLRAQSSA